MVKPRANEKSEKSTRGPSGPSDRRRGRPIGKNRVPLTIEERRARNAYYERERRNELGNAFSELAAALSVDHNIPHAELLAKTVTFIREKTENSAAVIERQNAKLEWQIQKLAEELSQKEGGVQGL